MLRTVGSRRVGSVQEPSKWKQYMAAILLATMIPFLIAAPSQSQAQNRSNTSVIAGGTFGMCIVPLLTSSCKSEQIELAMRNPQRIVMQIYFSPTGNVFFFGSKDSGVRMEYGLTTSSAMSNDGKILNTVRVNSWEPVLEFSYENRPVEGGMILKSQYRIEIVGRTCRVLGYEYTSNWSGVRIFNSTPSECRVANGRIPFPGK